MSIGYRPFTGRPYADPMSTLARRLGLTDAVVIGLGSMIGAGVFAVFAPAAAAAGSGLLIGLAIAALVAFCNATSSAQLAATWPEAGGTYVYGRRQLGEWWGFLAGWGFVVGKTASCAAMALTAAAYLIPGGFQRPAAAVFVLAIAAVNCRGITKTAALARVLLVAVLAVLLLVAVGTVGHLQPLGSLTGSTTPYGILQSAGLLFFAFAGYARIATLGEEVRDPEQTIPRAIITALVITIAVYLLIGVGVLSVLGDRLADSSTPLATAMTAIGWMWAAPIVRIGAGLAALGALLGLVAGVGRTTLAMARDRELPAALDAVHPRFQVPHRAELAVGVLVAAVVLVVDLRGAIGFSSFGVLLYYFVANVAAFSQGDDRRRYPKPLQVIGALGCLILVATLPLYSVLGGLVVFAAGIGYRLVRRSVGKGSGSGSGASSSV